MHGTWFYSRQCTDSTWAESYCRGRSLLHCGTGNGKLSINVCLSTRHWKERVSCIIAKENEAHLLSCHLHFPHQHLFFFCTASNIWGYHVFVPMYVHVTKLVNICFWPSVTPWDLIVGPTNCSLSFWSAVDCTPKSMETKTKSKSDLIDLQLIKIIATN